MEIKGYWKVIGFVVDCFLTIVKYSYVILRLIKVMKVMSGD